MIVLHYIHTLDETYGGVSSYMQLLSKSLGSLCDLHILTTASYKELSVENCTLHYIDGLNLNIRKFYKSIYHSLNKIKPDIVHINGCWLPQYSIVALCAKSLGYTVVISPHGMLEPWDIKKNYWTKKLPALLLYQKRAIKKADILIATSDVEKQNLINLGYNNNVTIVPNGIDINDVQIKKTWQEKKQMLFLALLRKNKGVDILLDAVAMIKEKLQGWTIVVAGLPADYSIEDVVQMSNNLGLTDMVKVIGGVSGVDKWNLYKESDVYVLPTLNENFGIVIAESLLCGTPVITTKGAPWPLLDHNKCGWRIDRNAKSFSSAILEFLDMSVVDRESMGIRGRNLVVNNFSSVKVAQKMLDVYKSI